jgi:vesicle coat complex subunit
MQHTFDIDFEDCEKLTVERIVEMYSCTEEQAEEAMKYVVSFIGDYDPKDSEDYEKELSEFLKKMDDKDYELGTLEDADEFARKRNGL